MRSVALAAIATALALVAGACGGSGKDPLRIGVLAVCQGAYAPFYEPILGGAELPLLERGGHLVGTRPSEGVEGAKVAGRRIDLFIGCSDDSGSRALAEARRLVEQDHVSVLVGPETSAAGIAIRDYARTKPNVVFMIAVAPAVEPTLQRPAPNVFRFTTDAIQWTAGLGTYAYQTLGWRRAVVIGNDFQYPYAEAAGFISEFCALGGNIVKRIYGDSPRRIPAGVDGYFLSEFVPQYLIPAVDALPVHGNLADKVVLGAASMSAAGLGALGARSVGVAGGSAAPIGSSVPTWTRYIAAFRKAYPDLQFLDLSVFYFTPMDAALTGLEAIDGDISDSGQRLRTALARTEITTPTGPVRLNGHRQAIAPNYVTQVVHGPSGFSQRTIRTYADVDDSYAGRFSPRKPMPSRTYPPCRRGNPPRWAKS